MQRNSNNIDEELNRKYEEVNGLKDENEELIEEVERLREDLEKAQANNEKHRRRKYNTFEVSLKRPSILSTVHFWVVYGQNRPLLRPLISSFFPFGLSMVSTVHFEYRPF